MATLFISQDSEPFRERALRMHIASTTAAFVRFALKAANAKTPARSGGRP